MIVRLMIDGMVTQIDTRNPQLLAVWLAEQFTRIDWTPATVVEAQAWPSWARDRQATGGYSSDWIPDSRYLGVPLPVRSPEEMLAALGDELARYRAGEGER